VYVRLALERVDHLEHDSEAIVVAIVERITYVEGE
jgi:hypothetical protein